MFALHQTISSLATVKGELAVEHFPASLLLAVAWNPSYLAKWRPLGILASNAGLCPCQEGLTLEHIRSHGGVSLGRVGGMVGV